MLDDQDAPLKLLSEVFGHAEFRDGQRDIVDAVIAGENTLAIMPTGGGKSLCFQLPALCIEGVNGRDFAADCADARSGAGA